MSKPIIQKPFALKALIKTVCRLQQPAARLKKIHLSIGYGPGIPPIVLGDAYRIKRILLNILSNAIKFTAQGYVKLTIRTDRVSKKSQKTILQFIIRDSGIGIPKEKLDSIYEKFNKLTPSNKGLYPGHGVGLHIVRQFVTDLEGTFMSPVK